MMNLSIEQPLLRFDFQGTDPSYQVNETLALFENGQAVLWSLAAVEKVRRRFAGTYGLTMDQTTLHEVKELAELLVNHSADPTRGRFRRIAVEEHVTAHFGSKSEGHNLNSSQDDPLPVTLEPVMSLRSRLLSALLEAPLSVVELGARQDLSAGKPVLNFTCCSRGSQPVQILFTPDSLAVQHQGESGHVLIWQNKADIRMGLVGELGKLFDGLYAPADIPPGKQGTIIISLDAPLAAIEKGEIYMANLEGMVQLTGPGLEAGTFPSTPFVLQCPLD